MLPHSPPFGGGWGNMSSSGGVFYVQVAYEKIISGLKWFIRKCMKGFTMLKVMFGILFLVGLTVNAQTINVHGTVSNQAGKPIANAIVKLVKQQLADTTGADGAYSITKPDVAVLPLLIPQNRTIFMDKGFLEFSLPNPSPVKIEIFDVKGNLLK